MATNLLSVKFLQFYVIDTSRLKHLLENVHNTTTHTASPDDHGTIEKACVFPWV